MKTTPTCTDMNNFIISIRYKQNHPNIVLGIVITDRFISISLYTLILLYVAYMQKKLVDEVKNERGSVEKGTENEKRSRMREKRKRTMQTYIHTHGDSVNPILSFACLCIVTTPRYCRRRRLFSNHNRLRVRAHSHKKFSTSLFLRRIIIIITKSCLKEAS